MVERYINGETVFSITAQPGVPRSTVYAWMKAYRNKRDNTWYAKRREELLEKIQKIYDDSKRPFCADKTAAVTREEGYRVSPEMVRELMRDMGPISIRQDAKSLYDKETRRYENHLNQQFTAKNPNEIWVSDVTHFRFNDKNFCICAILDLYARTAVGYRIN